MLCSFVWALRLRNALSSQRPFQKVPSWQRRGQRPFFSMAVSSEASEDVGTLQKPFKHPSTFYWTEQVRSRREYIKDLHTKNDEIKEALTKYFDEDAANPEENVYLNVGTLFSSMPDRHSNDDSPDNLAALVLSTFAEWLEDKNFTELQEKYLNSDIQTEAIKSCSGKASVHLKAVSQIFDLNEEKIDLLISQNIQKLIDKKMFKEALDMIVLHKKESEFSFEDLIIPLLLQDKAVCVHEFLRNRPDFQKSLIEFYDGLVLKNEEEAEEILKPYAEVRTLPLERFYGKTMEKVMNTFFQKVVKQYGFTVDSTMAPNLCRLKIKKSLRHYISTRHDPTSKIILTDDCYFQIIQQIMSQSDLKMQRSFIAFLGNSSCRERIIDAISLKKYLKIPDTFFPEILEADPEIEREADLLLEKRLKAQEAATDVVELNCEGVITQVYLINTLEKFQNFVEDLEGFVGGSGEKLIGFDTEWKPGHSHSACRSALLQLYFDDRVFIIDVVALEEEDSEIWCRFAEAFLCSETLKIGFSLRPDVDLFLELPQLQDWTGRDRQQGVFCIKRFGEKLNEAKPGALGMETFKLGDLSAKFCSVVLNKSEQCSDWSARPLRNGQLLYAAMDAYIVVKIYEKMKEFVNEIGLTEEEVQSVSVEAMTAQPKKDKSKAKKLDLMSLEDLAEVLRDSVDVEKPTIRPQDLKCIVDVMLKGLGKQMKRFGVDALIPTTASEFETVVAQRGDRIVITCSGKSFVKLQTSVEPDSLLCLPPCLDIMEQLRIVFSHFNIKINL